MTAVSMATIERAVSRIDDTDLIRETPVERSRALESSGEGTVYLKMEHLQRTGSFKPRGAYNKLAELAAEQSVSHVVAASAGNHAQGVAIAADHFGLDALVVMPETAPQAKIDATRAYGAEVTLEGRDFNAAMDYAKTEADTADTRFIHAYDDPMVVAGQGTLGIEILDQCPDVDTILVPIGGGGLVGGVGRAVKARKPDVTVVGVQAEGAATVPDSLQKGLPVTIDDPMTIADGIATGSVSELTLGLIEQFVDEVVVVSDDDIAVAIQLLIERAKQVVEGAGAASVAALVSDADVASGECIVPLLCGGNIDTTTLQEVLRHALVNRHQFVELTVEITDRPGEMGSVSAIIGDHGVNIRTVRHERYREDLSISQADLVFEIETNGQSHLETVMAALEEEGYRVKRDCITSVPSPVE
jgi:threonine dehydratase